MERIQQASTSHNHPDPEDILGQFFFAFGQGAGSMRVQRSAIAALRRRYRPAIWEAHREWNSAAPHVLSLIAQVGRLAATLATQAGRAAISEGDFVTARRAVEASAHTRAAQGGRLIAGPYCPAVAGEFEETSVSVPTVTEAPSHPEPRHWDTRPLAPAPAH